MELASLLRTAPPRHGSQNMFQWLEMDATSETGAGGQLTEVMQGVWIQEDPKIC